MVKLLDPTRLVDHASGWHDQGAGDFKSTHRYVFPYTAPKDSRAIALSEFGGYSFKVPNHVQIVKKAFGYIPFSS